MVVARMEQKDFLLELKTVSDDGTFEGYLSVYGVVDLGNDRVLKGAFTRTIDQNKGMVPLLWNHDDTTPLGMLYLSDDDYGLKVRGEMFVNEVPKAAEIHAAAKRYQALGRPMGLSIGYQAIQKAFVEGVRDLKEIRLWEGSMTLFPMLMPAQLTSIKSRRTSEQKDDFQSELEEIQLYAMRYMMIQAIDCSLCDILYDPTLSPDEKNRLSGESIDQFKSAYAGGFLPNWFAMLGEMTPMEAMSAMKERLTKIGRRNSSADSAAIKQAIEILQSLVTEELAEPDKALSTSPVEQASDPAATVHSTLGSLIEQMGALIPAA